SRAAMMLPALAKAKDKAARTNCVSTQRQPALAMRMYTTDNREFLPYPNWGSPPHPNWRRVPASLDAPAGDAAANMAVITYSDNRELAYRTGLYYQYMPNPKTYLCPVDTKSRYYRLRLNKLSTYVMNGAVCGFVFDPIRSAKITSIHSTMC